MGAHVVVEGGTRRSRLMAAECFIVRWAVISFSWFRFRGGGMSLQTFALRVLLVRDGLALGLS